MITKPRHIEELILQDGQSPKRQSSTSVTLLVEITRMLVHESSSSHKHDLEPSLIKVIKGSKRP